MTFSLSSDPIPSEIAGAVNYLLANFTSNVYANDVSGQVVGPNGEVLSYLYKWIGVKYADSFDGTLNFSNSPTDRLYYGLRNTDDSIEPSAPQDYVWYRVTGGFGTTKFLFYSTKGGRQVKFAVATTKPDDGYKQDTGSAIDLDVITAPAFSAANYVIYRVPNDSSAPTNAESQTALSRNPIFGDIATINYNNGANSIEYRFNGTSWIVQNRYITGDLIENLVNIDTPISTAQYIDVNTTLANPSYLEGRVFYDNTSKSLSYYNDVSDVTVNLGQEQLVRVYNAGGTAILNGQICYVNGGYLTFPTVALAKADIAATSEAVIGMATNDIASGEFGYITTSGIVHDIDTSAYTDGTTLYLSDTVAGGFTDTLPQQPSYNIIIGYVTNQGATTGDVFVHVDKLPWYPHLNLLDSVASVALPTTPTVFVLPTIVDADGFSYNTTTGVITVNTNGTYTLCLTINASPSAANKHVYAYLEIDTGSGWTINRYSARDIHLTNGTAEQINMITSAYFATGTKIRFYVWGDSTVTLTSVDLPGTTPGTVTLAAAQFSMA